MRRSHLIHIKPHASITRESPINHQSPITNYQIDCLVLRSRHIALAGLLLVSLLSPLPASAAEVRRTEATQTGASKTTGTERPASGSEPAPMTTAGSDEPLVDLWLNDVQATQVLHGEDPWVGKETLILAYPEFSKICRSSASAASPSNLPIAVSAPVPFSHDTDTACGAHPVVEHCTGDDYQDSFITSKQHAVRIGLETEYLDAQGNAYLRLMPLSGSAESLHHVQVDFDRGGPQPLQTRLLVWGAYSPEISPDTYRRYLWNGLDAFTMKWYGNRVLTDYGNPDTETEYDLAFIRLTATIDPNNCIVETNETNNHISRTIPVRRSKLTNKAGKPRRFQLLVRALPKNEEELSTQQSRRQLYSEIADMIYEQLVSLVERSPLGGGGIRSPIEITQHATPEISQWSSEVIQTEARVRFSSGENPIDFGVVVADQILCGRGGEVGDTRVYCHALAPRATPHTVFLARSASVDWRPTLIHELTHQFGFGHPKEIFRSYVNPGGTCSMPVVLFEQDSGVEAKAGYLNGKQNLQWADWLMPLPVVLPIAVADLNWISEPPRQDYMTYEFEEIWSCPYDEEGRFIGAHHITTNLSGEWDVYIGTNQAHWNAWRAYLSNPTHNAAAAAATAGRILILGRRDAHDRPVLTQVSAEPAEAKPWDRQDGPYRLRVLRGDGYQLASGYFGVVPPTPPAGEEDTGWPAGDMSFGFSMPLNYPIEHVASVEVRDPVGALLSTYVVPTAPLELRVAAPVMVYGLSCPQGCYKIGFALSKTEALQPSVFVSYSIDGGESFQPYTTVTYDPGSLRGHVLLDPTILPAADALLVKVSAQGWTTVSQTVALPPIPAQPLHLMILKPEDGSQYPPEMSEPEGELPVDTRMILLSAGAYDPGSLQEPSEEQLATCLEWLKQDVTTGTYVSLGLGSSLPYQVSDGPQTLALRWADADGCGMVPGGEVRYLHLSGVLQTTPEVELKEVSLDPATPIEADMSGIFPAVHLSVALRSLRVESEVVLTVRGTGPGLTPGQVLAEVPVNLPANQTVTEQMTLQPVARAYGTAAYTITVEQAQPAEAPEEMTNNQTTLAVELNPPRVRLVESHPAMGGTLPKQQKNLITLTFEAPVTFSGVPLRIRQRLGAGTYGPPLNHRSFTMGLGGDSETRTSQSTQLFVTEQGAAFSPGGPTCGSRWYVVEPTEALQVAPPSENVCTDEWCNWGSIEKVKDSDIVRQPGRTSTPPPPRTLASFQLHVATLLGDVDGDHQVTAADVGLIQEKLGAYGGGAREDLDGDQRITQLDVELAAACVGSVQADWPNW